MTARRCLTDVEVAAKLGRDRAWFARNKKRLIEKEGFPPMLPILRRWDEAAIDAWLDGFMNSVTITLNAAEPDDEDLQADDEDLQADEDDLVARAAELAADQARPH